MGYRMFCSATGAALRIDGISTLLLLLLPDIKPRSFRLLSRRGPSQP